VVAINEAFSLITLTLSAAGNKSQKNSVAISQGALMDFHFHRNFTRHSNKTPHRPLKTQPLTG